MSMSWRFRTPLVRYNMRVLTTHSSPFSIISYIFSIRKKSGSQFLLGLACIVIISMPSGSTVDQNQTSGYGGSVGSNQPVDASAGSWANPVDTSRNSAGFLVVNVLRNSFSSSGGTVGVAGQPRISTGTTSTWGQFHQTIQSSLTGSNNNAPITPPNLDTNNNFNTGTNVQQREFNSGFNQGGFNQSSFGQSNPTTGFQAVTQYPGSWQNGVFDPNPLPPAAALPTRMPNQSIEVEKRNASSKPMQTTRDVLKLAWKVGIMYPVAAILFLGSAMVRFL
jgi:hypothetical protein